MIRDVYLFTCATILGLMLLGCKTSNGGGQRPSYVNLEYFDVSKGVVLEGEQAAALFEPCSRSAPQRVDEAWTPTSDRIERLEAFIPDFLIENPSAGRAPTEEYYRQYAGFTRGGRYYIYANFFTIPADSPAMGTWRNEAVNVCDGGEEFFGIVFDVIDESFSDYRVNRGVSRRELETSAVNLEVDSVQEDAAEVDEVIVAPNSSGLRLTQESNPQDSPSQANSSDLIWPSDNPQALPSIAAPVGSNAESIQPAPPATQSKEPNDMDEVPPAPKVRNAAAVKFQDNLTPWPTRKF